MSVFGYWPSGWYFGVQVQIKVSNTDVKNKTSSMFPAHDIRPISIQEVRNDHDDMVVRQNFPSSLSLRFGAFETNGHSSFIRWNIFKTVPDFLSDLACESRKHFQHLCGRYFSRWLALFIYLCFLLCFLFFFFFFPAANNKIQRLSFFLLCWETAHLQRIQLGFNQPTHFLD